MARTGHLGIAMGYAHGPFGAMPAALAIYVICNSQGVGVNN